MGLKPFLLIKWFYGIIIPVIGRIYYSSFHRKRESKNAKGFSLSSFWLPNRVINPEVPIGDPGNRGRYRDNMVVEKYRMLCFVKETLDRTMLCMYTGRKYRFCTSHVTPWQL